MKPKSVAQNQDQLFKTRLSQMINPNHELCKLAASIPWQTIEEECAEYFTVGASRPPVPTTSPFGCKVCILLTEKKGVIPSSKVYPGVPYDSYLLKAAKKNGEENSSATIKRILVDLGFRKHDVDDAKALISRTKKLPIHLKKILKRRQAIEP